MAFFETTRLDGSVRKSRPTFLSTLLSAIAGWNERRATRRSLLALSDHQLADIGLTRGDVERMGF